MSTSCLEVLLRQKEGQERVAKWITEFNPMRESLMRRLFRLATQRRPHTDDMIQMLDDLGIETPVRNLPKATFQWR